MKGKIMIRTRFIVGAVLAVAGLLSTTTAAAQAAEFSPYPPSQKQTTSAVRFERSPELTAYLDKLNPSQRAEFIGTNLPATSTVTTDQKPDNAAAAASVSTASSTGNAVTPLAVGCWTGRVDWTVRAAAGNGLYSYYHVGRWCSNGSSVTSASIADKGAQTYTVGWRYAGVTASGSGVVSNQGRSYTQHKFILGVGGWDVDTRLECGRVRGQSTGGYLYDTTCGIY